MICDDAAVVNAEPVTDLILPDVIPEMISMSSTVAPLINN
jgi:hypothetical protein